MLFKLWIGRNSSTCGKIARMPEALASNPSKRSKGLSHTSLRQERCKRSISFCNSSVPSRSNPSVNSSTIAPCPNTRRDHWRLNLCRLVPIRVPPDQSATCSVHFSKASSGSRLLSERVTLVSRVPNKNVCTRLRLSVIVWRKCKNSRV